jgi:hypothetical protein
MDVHGLWSEFLRPVALGAGAVLALLVVLSLRMPRRAKVGARPQRHG